MTPIPIAWTGDTCSPPMNENASGTRTLADATPATTPIFPRSNARSTRTVPVTLTMPPNTPRLASLGSNTRSWLSNPMTT